MLLEGDQYVCSNEGIARTFYQVENTSQLASSSLSVEEIFDIQAARKKFVLRESSGEMQSRRKKRKPTVHMGDPIQILDFQEINQGVSNGAGTGAITWESSLAMTLLFSARPELLKGDIIELGSGTGAGGILMSSLTKSSEVQSVTLTDCNAQVLEQCKENIKSCKAIPNLKVVELDWYDVVRNTQKSRQHLHQYDTIIACDCAYLYPDVEALSQTMVRLLRKGSESRIHIFGPYNRGAIQELLRFLKREEYSLKVESEWIDINRFRMEPPPHWSTSIFSTSDNECSFTTKSNARFLHITCSFAQTKTEIQTSTLPMNDID
jgi:16S rRNA G966 N2-methylase RsmD